MAGRAQGLASLTVGVECPEASDSPPQVLRVLDFHAESSIRLWCSALPLPTGRCAPEAEARGSGTTGPGLWCGLCRHGCKRVCTQDSGGGGQGTVACPLCLGDWRLPLSRVPFVKC